MSDNIRHWRECNAAVECGVAVSGNHQRRLRSRMGEQNTQKSKNHNFIYRRLQGSAIWLLTR